MMTLREASELLNGYIEGEVSLRHTRLLAVKQAIDEHLAQPIDLHAVREVIDELLSQPFIDRSHEWRAEIANKLSRAIGDTP